jgi:uracil-DNA glycosylase
MRPAELEPGRSTPIRPGIRRTLGSDAAAAWSDLERTIRSCQRCPLGATRTHAVIYRGSLRPRIVFVGEAPGATEDRLGLPFVGRSGQRLDASIEEAGIEPEEFGILNLLKCRPPDNRFDRLSAATCRPYLDRQLSLLQPSVLVSLGAHALRSLDPTAPRVLLAAGRARPLDRGTLFPMIHPAAALRSRAMTERWRNDFVALRDWLTARSSAPAREPS